MKGKVYKLTCESGKVYIGSTNRTLDERFKEHISKNNYCASNGFISPVIELLEEIEYNKDELLWKEREYIKKIKCVNKNKPILTKKEKKDKAKKGCIIYNKYRR